MIFGITELDILSPLITVMIFVILIGLMLIAFYKIKIYEIVLIIFLFSLFIGIMSISQNILVFTPNFQIFFILFQGILLFYASIHREKR